jgi:hypothetical protein
MLFLCENPHYWIRVDFSQALSGRMPEESCISQNYWRISDMGTCLARMSDTVPIHRVLIVEPDAALRFQLRTVVETVAGVDAEPGVPTARQRLLTTPHDWLVTNVRLDAYNGLHLAYLARMAPQPPKILVYGDETDLLLAREAQELGAFYESKAAIVRSLAAYLLASLPGRDRRNVAVRDRRMGFRGGRRNSDFEHVRGQNVGRFDSARVVGGRPFRDL